MDDLTADEIREHRGTLTEPGRNSPWRDRSVEENLDLFARMRAGEFENGARVLRAKIDMASPNIIMRDPVLYRIVHATHPRTGDAWSIYPTYDFAHGQSDAIEGITHSICTLEFEIHRPLYDWCIEHLPVPSRPRQYEFARLNLTYTVLSKRVLLRLVNDGFVHGWDDPRMPTIAGLRRRGFPAEGLRNFAAVIGVAKADSVHEIAMLEHEIRGVLNRTSARRFGVLNPLKVVIENYPDGVVESMEVVNNPEDPSAGTRAVEFSRELWIERDDFMEEPAPKFFRLAPGREVRLRQRVLRHVHRGGQGRRRGGGGAPLHLRPRDAWRGLARRAEGQGDAALGLGGARRPGGGAAVRPPLRAAGPGRGRRPVRGPQPGVGSVVDRGDAGARARGGARRRDGPVRAARATSRRTLDSRPDALVFNRTLTLKDTWAKVQAKG